MVTDTLTHTHTHTHTRWLFILDDFFGHKLKNEIDLIKDDDNKNEDYLKKSVNHQNKKCLKYQKK